MKRTIFILFLFLFLFIPRTKSQIVQESHPAYKHFYHAVIDNDTVLKKFTLSQGKILIKLINRECNQSSYELIKAFLGSFRANFWQFFGKIFGASLKTDWDPEGEDKTIERICILVEQGSL